MNSFFSELSDFFSQVAFLFNWALDFVFSLLASSTDVINVFSDYSSSFPSELSWILPLTFSVMAFHFIRGHW